MKITISLLSLIQKCATTENRRIWTIRDIGTFAQMSKLLRFNSSVPHKGNLYRYILYSLQFWSYFESLKIRLDIPLSIQFGVIMSKNDIIELLIFKVQFI